MNFRLSAFGEHFTRMTGALELMDDLGHALARGGDVALLGGGNPARVPEVQAYLAGRLEEIAHNRELLDRAISNYAHPSGEMAFRRAVARLLQGTCGWPVTEANIALTAGSQAAFFLLFNLFAGPAKDGGLRRLMLPLTPEYIGYADIGLTPGMLAARRPIIEEWPGRRFKYRVDFDGFAIGDDIGALCVSRPTNPTGNVITDDELTALAARCRDAGVPLILDGAYGLPFPGIVYTAATPYWDDNVVLCLSLSKLGLPGVRTGIIVANEAVIEAVTRMTAVVSLAVGSVGPVLAEPLVESGRIVQLGREVLAPFYRRKAQFAASVLDDALAGLPYRLHEPEGAFFLWLWLPGLPIGSRELYRRLKAEGVFVLSGHEFFPGLDEPWAHRDECLRISVAAEDSVLEGGLRVVAREVRRAFASA